VSEEVATLDVKVEEVHDVFDGLLPIIRRLVRQRSTTAPEL